MSLVDCRKVPIDVGDTVAFMRWENSLMAGEIVRCTPKNVWINFQTSYPNGNKVDEVIRRHVESVMKVILP